MRRRTTAPTPARHIVADLTCAFVRFVAPDEKTDDQSVTLRGLRRLVQHQARNVEVDERACGEAVDAFIAAWMPDWYDGQLTADESDALFAAVGQREIGTTTKTEARVAA